MAKQKKIDLEHLTEEEKMKYEIAGELGLLDTFNMTYPKSPQTRSSASCSDRFRSSVIVDFIRSALPCMSPVTKIIPESPPSFFPILFQFYHKQVFLQMETPYRRWYGEFASFYAV